MRLDGMTLQSFTRFVKPASRYGLVWLFVSTAVMHVVRPAPFVRIVPPYFPHALALVYLTGIGEFVCGVGLLFTPSRRLAATCLVVLLVAVFPANVNMALHPERFRDIATASFFWFRLPLQLVYVAWTAWCGELVAPPSSRPKGSRR